MAVLRGLPPIIDERARALVLGSFPSEASLAAGQYYAHRRNQFWPMLSALIGSPLPDMDYMARQAAVRAAGLAIWDVFARCEREGSLDSAIRNAKPNDFRRLRGWAPDLALVCFNGRTAARLVETMADLGYATAVLPSTSPAHAGMSFGAKVAAWRAALGPFLSGTASEPGS